MVIKGESRGGAADIAAHLQRTDQNELAELRGLRGTIADNLTDALLEMEAVASGARSKLHFYHAKINSRIDEPLTEIQKDRSIELLGEKLGLAGQPRAVMEHVKDGRHHLHVVWSRIDLETMKAIPDSHNYRIHEEVARQLEREFGFEHTQGAHIERQGKERPGRTPSLDDMQMAGRTGIEPKQLREQLGKLFHAADSGKAFAAALDSAGLTLARGDKRNVLVILDAEGGTHALNKGVTGLSAADTRKRLADLDAGMLPSVDQARQAQRDRQREKAAELPPAQEPQPPGVAKEPETPGRLVAEPSSEATQRPSYEAEKAAEPSNSPEIGQSQPPAADRTADRTADRERDLAAEYAAWEAAAPPFPDAADLNLEPDPIPSQSEPSQKARKRGLDEPEQATGKSTAREPERTHAPKNEPGGPSQPRPGTAPDFWADLQKTLAAKRRAEAEREARAVDKGEQWFSQSGGWENLTPEQQHAARAGYEKWQGARPERQMPEAKERFDLGDYVRHVQRREAERQRDGEERYAPRYVAPDAPFISPFQQQLAYSLEYRMEMRAARKDAPFISPAEQRQAAAATARKGREAAPASPGPAPRPELAPSPLRVGKLIGKAIDAAYRVMGVAADAIGSLFEAKPEPQPAPEWEWQAKQPKPVQQPEKSPTDLFLEEFESRRQYQPPAPPEPPPPAPTHQHEYRLEFGPRPPNSRTPHP